MKNCTLALDLYRKCRRTVPGTISVAAGRPLAIAVLIISILPFASSSW